MARQEGGTAGRQEFEAEGQEASKVDGASSCLAALRPLILPSCFLPSCLASCRNGRRPADRRVARAGQPVAQGQADGAAADQGSSEEVQRRRVGGRAS